MLTLTAIKVDIGSVGDRLRLSSPQLAMLRQQLAQAVEEQTLTDFDITQAGRALCLLLVHPHGNGSPITQTFAHQLSALSLARPWARLDVAEIAFDPATKAQSAEPFLLLTAEQWGPTAYNLPLWSVFSSQMFGGGLLLPQFKPTFRLLIGDHLAAEGEPPQELTLPDQQQALMELLRDDNHFHIRAIYSGRYPYQQIVAVADTQSTASGSPLALVRTAGCFPSPSDFIRLFLNAQLPQQAAASAWTVSSTPSNGQLQPTVACVAYTVNRHGKLATRVDLFSQHDWEPTSYTVSSAHSSLANATMRPVRELADQVKYAGAPARVSQFTIPEPAPTDEEFSFEQLFYS